MAYITIYHMWKKIGVVDCDEEIRKLEYFDKCDINTFYRDVKYLTWKIAKNIKTAVKISASM